MILKILLNVIILIFVPFLSLGIIKKTKAFWAGRCGASVFQPLYDFLKLIKKAPVYSDTTSFIFKITPFVNLGALICASLFVPLVSGSAIINIPVGFIIFAYILAFAKFFSLLSALDTGSSFEGMGASREACFSTIVEPAFFIALGSVFALSGATTFDGLRQILNIPDIYAVLIAILLVITLFIMLLIEGCRVPVDDPETHLELTMIHEVMILDNSGIDLAFITYASAIKIFLFEALIAAILMPFKMGLLASLLLFLLIIFLLSIAIGTVEAISARYRMSHIFEFIFVMTIGALLILTLVTYTIFGS